MFSSFELFQHTEIRCKQCGGIVPKSTGKSKRSRSRTLPVLRLPTILKRWNVPSPYQRLRCKLTVHREFRDEITFHRSRSAPPWRGKNDPGTAPSSATSASHQTRVRCLDGTQSRSKILKSKRNEVESFTIYHHLAAPAKSTSRHKQYTRFSEISAARPPNANINSSIAPPPLATLGNIPQVQTPFQQKNASPSPTSRGVTLGAVWAAY